MVKTEINDKTQQDLQHAKNAKNRKFGEKILNVTYLLNNIKLKNYSKNIHNLSKLDITYLSNIHLQTENTQLTKLFVIH